MSTSFPKILVVVFLSSICQWGLGQHSLGFFLGYGSQIGNAVDYHYDVFLVEGQYSGKLKSWDNWIWKYEIRPQINLTLLGDGKRSTGLEFGVNVGSFLEYNLNSKTSGYVGLGLGPHYISKSLERQAPGFIFSDNIYVGIRWQLDTHLHMDSRINFRHISNANLQQPNGGINNIILSLGVIYSRLKT